MSRKIFAHSLLIISAVLAIAANQTAIVYGQTLDEVCPDKTKEPCATAKKMIQSASVVVTGEESKGDDWTFMANKMLTDAQIGEAKFKERINLKDAVEFWKSWLASPFTGDGNRDKVINLAFLEVYGKLPLKIERDVWMKRINAREAWYAAIVSKEISNLNSAEVRRRDLIKRAYSNAFGRPPTDGDFQFWVPRAEHYRPLLSAQRTWMYSDNGLKDLRGAVRVALYPKFKREPTEAEIDEGIKKVKPNRLIYLEMVPVLQK
jgi:hypothetical protein